ncbi:Tn3 transposase DDE domain-containing protein [Nocardia ignorata]|uniref:Tn3 transposase DDE domain-containing protein n=1 Tax=Nocardia ignorata TaxID=145285 RepID=A0A4R6P5B1_NOCIG|nr:Tn3 family transposase [Nocardia ignorata]TDP33018.1 Tn3 transposase DDE domain-containing protein [Nocardia ignorata]
MLSPDLFADASEKLVDAWRSRAARSFPSDLRDMPSPIMLTLLAALCWVRSAEITDALVDLLIELVHKVNTRADRRVEKELTEDLRRVRGKENILFRLAEAAVDHPDDIVREALYPVVGEKTLRELVKEAKANDQVFQARVRTVLRSSYSNHYRRMLPALLAALDSRCNNTAYRPVMVAMELLGRYASIDGKVRFYDTHALAPLEGVVPKAWREAVVDEKRRVERIPYELCVLVALRDAIRRREIYVEGGNRWRNPEDDLPGDFDTAREVHYAAIRQPLDPTEFIGGLKQRMNEALNRLDTGLAENTTGGVRLTRRRGEQWISEESEAALRHVRRHFITRDNLRRATTKLVNATFAARDPNWWGSGTACASDSKKFGSWESNLMTQYHQHYGGYGVMIYWHVERRNVCIYSQLKSCSSSEVAAMIEGLLRHCTDAEIGRITLIHKALRWSGSPSPNCWDSSYCPG